MNQWVSAPHAPCAVSTAGLRLWRYPIVEIHNTVYIVYSPWPQMQPIFFLSFFLLLVHSEERERQVLLIVSRHAVVPTFQSSRQPGS